MSYKFKKVETVTLFLSYFPRKATEAERGEGLPEMVSGFRSSGDPLVDLLLRIFHEKGYVSRLRAASLLGVKEKLLQSTVPLLTGHTFSELRDILLVRMIDDLLMQTSLTFAQIAKHLNFKDANILSHFYRRATKISLFEKRKGRKMF